MALCSLVVQGEVVGDKKRTRCVVWTAYLSTPGTPLLFLYFGLGILKPKHAGVHEIREPVRGRGRLCGSANTAACWRRRILGLSTESFQGHAGSDQVSAARYCAIASLGENSLQSNHDSEYYLRWDMY